MLLRWVESDKCGEDVLRRVHKQGSTAAEKELRSHPPLSGNAAANAVQGRG